MNLNTTPKPLQCAPTGAQAYYIFADHLNTPRLIADATGTTVWRWDNQEPFGNDSPNADPNSTGNSFDFPLRFPGQYFDRETNLAYNYFRDYDPGIGRYIESDPIGLVGGINTYAYGSSSPLVRTDELGLLGSRGRSLGCGSGWNFPLVPDNPLGFPFGGCCAGHDSCYDDCANRPSRAKCDGDFCACVSSKCQTYARGQKQSCDSLARTYCDAVKNNGEEAFRRARSKCPSCK
jgi:RHS repeat-associated protein